MAGLEVKNLNKTYKQGAVVNDVSLQIEAGKFVCFLGPSGCGKTTLLRMIAGLEAPTSGSIVFNSKDITDTPPMSEISVWCFRLWRCSRTSI
jgi:ABC-type Fe3+/spermidine/putrescine transport system ATPase subunit